MHDFQPMRLNYLITMERWGRGVIWLKCPSTFWRFIDKLSRFPYLILSLHFILRSPPTICCLPPLCLPRQHWPCPNCSNRRPGSLRPEMRCTIWRQGKSGKYLSSHMADIQIHVISVKRYQQISCVENLEILKEFYNFRAFIWRLYLPVWNISHAREDFGPD